MNLHNAGKFGRLLVGATLMLALVTLVPTPEGSSAATNDKPGEAVQLVSGTWLFANRDDTAFLPARHMLTMVCDTDGNICDDRSLNHTDMDGNFALSTERFSGEPVVRVKLWAWASYGVGDQSNNVAVNGAGPGAPDGPWGYTSRPFNAVHAIEHEIRFDQEMLPAFWIMDDFTDGMLKIPATQQGLIKVQAYWGPEFNQLPLPPIPKTRSLFCHGSLGALGVCFPGFMYLFAGDIRSVEDSIGLLNRLPLHEMGHAVQYYLYGEKLPAPTTDYYLFSLGSWSLQPCAEWFPDVAIPGEPDCAWQEGFATWWQLYVQGSPIITDRIRTLDYEDTSGWDPGDETPGRIAGALWDMFDDVDDGTDASEAGFTYIWHVLLNYSHGGNPDDIDRSLADYWATWRALHPIGTDFESLQCAATSTYQNEITYDADGWVPCGYALTDIGLQITPGGETMDQIGQSRVPLGMGAGALESLDGKLVSPPGGIGAFDNLLSYDPEGMEILGADFSGTGFTGQLDLSTSRRIKVRGTATRGINPPVALAFIFPRLSGSALNTYSMGFLSPQPAEPYTYAATRTGAGSTGGPKFIHFRRGNARFDGRVDIADAMYIAQYLSGQRLACNLQLDDPTCMHAANAASVIHDGSTADKVTIGDARAIIEYVLGSRDEFFHLVPVR